MILRQAKKLHKDDEVRIKRSGEVGRVYCVQEVNDKLLWISVVLPDGEGATLTHKEIS